DRCLGVGPFAKLHKREPARLSGVAVGGQSQGSERADGSAVCTQFRLGHVIREVPNKKAHSHDVFLLGGWCMDTPTISATVLSREARRHGLWCARCATPGFACRSVIRKRAPHAPTWENAGKDHHRRCSDAAL